MKISVQRWVPAMCLALSILAPASSWANSKFLNVQGELTNSSGTPLTGNQGVTFRLYTSSTGGSAFWTETQTVSLSTGLFNVTLGTSTALDSTVFNQPYYLSIQVSGDSNQLSPRQQLGASAYAYGSLGDFAAGSNSTVSAATGTFTTRVLAGTSSDFTDTNGPHSLVIGGPVGITANGVKGSIYTSFLGVPLQFGTITNSSMGFFTDNGSSQFTLFTNDSASFGSAYNAITPPTDGLIVKGSVGIATSSPATTLDVAGSAQFGSTAKSTFTTTGALTLAKNTALTLSGGSGNIISASSVTASGFFGDGSHLTSVSAAAYQGVNYLLWSSSGPAVVISTGPGTFQVMASSFVFRGTEYSLSQTNFRSTYTYSAITWNPTSGAQIWPLSDLMPPTISSYTTTAWADDIILALSSAPATGVEHIFDVAWRSPLPGFFYTRGGRGITNEFNTNTNAQGYGCVSGAYYFESCITNTMSEVELVGSDWRATSDFYYDGGQSMRAMVVYNATSGSQNIELMDTGDGAMFFTVNGTGMTTVTSSGVSITNASVSPGYSSFIVYTDYNGSLNDVPEPHIVLPAGVSIVRGGYW